MYGWIFNKSWIFWLFVLLLIIFIIWIFDGRKNRKFIGVTPLYTGVDSSAYLDKQTINNINSIYPSFYDVESSRRDSSRRDSSRRDYSRSRGSKSSRSRDDKSGRSKSKKRSSRKKREEEREKEREEESEILETLSSLSDSDILWAPGTSIDLTPPLPEGLSSCIPSGANYVGEDKKNKENKENGGEEHIQERYRKDDIIVVAPGIKTSDTVESIHSNKPNYSTRDFSSDSIDDICSLDEKLSTPQPYKGGFKSKGEIKCREVAEKIFGVKFNTVRPDFLKNINTKRNLEIDCYNHELKIGIEYNGEHHYKWPNYTGVSYDEFVKQVQRDQMKVDLCDKHGIYLITVPYHVKEKDIESYIRYYLPDEGIRSEE